MRGAVQQAGAELLFQAADLPAQRRLGDKQGGGGAAEVPVLGDDGEVPDQPQVEIRRRRVGHASMVSPAPGDRQPREAISCCDASYVSPGAERVLDAGRSGPAPGITGPDSSVKEYTMRVFVTGATGFIGSAVVQELIDAGHQVLGLARSDAAAAVAGRGRGRGASRRSGRPGQPAPRRGRRRRRDPHRLHPRLLEDNNAAACEIDRRAIEALGEALAGSGRPLVVTSGTALHRAGPPRDRGRRGPRPGVSPRRSEEAALSLAGRGVRVSRGPPAAVGARRGRSRLRPDPHRRRAREGRVGLCGRRVQPLARRAPARCRPSLPARAGEGPAGARLTGSPRRACRSGTSPSVIGRRLNLPVTAMAPEEARTTSAGRAVRVDRHARPPAR